MKLVCPNCGYRTEAEVHTEMCPKCKSPMQIVKRFFKMVRRFYF